MDKQTRIIVVGGVAGGMSFATRYKRLNPHHEVIVIDKGPYVSFANCGLPYALSDVISKRHRLIVETKDRLMNRFGLIIYTEHEVTGVNVNNQTISVKNADEEFTLTYDKLVLSPGAKPFMISIPGLNERDVFTLRNIPDLDKMKTRLEQENIKDVIVIGAGFIGLEVAENLKMRGLNVTIVEKAPHVLPPFDEEMADFALEELTRNGINVFANSEVKEVKNKTAILASGQAINFDLVVMSIGVVPDTGFLNNSGIKLSPRGALHVDEHYQTSADNVYAVGDAILVKHEITRQDVSIALASPANRQGRQLADHLSGLVTLNKGSLGTAILKLFDLSFASTGLNERQLKQAGLKYRKLYLLANDHALYYPGATPINLKIMFDPQTSFVLGAQAIGAKGVDKRIDIIATAIKAKYPITDFPELELTYAPPFGTAKDIINLAGHYASNLMLGLTKIVEVSDVHDHIAQGAVLVDVRGSRERDRFGYIKDSIHLPLDMLSDRYDTLPKDKEIILYCESGIRSYNAERVLKGLGYNAKNMNGSYAIYSRVYKERIVR